jgi:7-keto-8-aminopelargonate synthetase-like enzyme
MMAFQRKFLMEPDKYQFYVQALEKKLQQKNYQQLKSILPESICQQENKKSLINFISFDFLNISEHPYVKKNAIKYVLKWGSGTLPSQIFSNHFECQKQLEEQMAKLVGKESCQFFQHHQQFHTLILSTLVPKQGTVYIDESCPANLYKAIPSSCKIIRFFHNDPHHLEKLLLEQNENPSHAWIILESLYTQEGDLVKLKEFLEISHRFKCFIYLDETNAFSVLGHHGLGLGALKKEVDCIVGLLQRASGSHAAFLVTKQMLKNYLLQFNSDLSFFQLLPPATLGAIEGYLQLIPDMHSERQKIMHLSRYLRSEMTQAGFCIKKSSCHLIIVHFDDEENFQSFVNHLVDENILAYIQKAELTIRFLVSLSHTKEILSDFLLRIKAWNRPLIYTKL